MAIARNYVPVIAKEKFNKMDKPVLSKRAFLEVDMEKIDYDKDALFVMEKVIAWGTNDDFMSLMRHYGKRRIRKEVVNTKFLGDMEVNFCCHVFKLDFADFKFYKKGVLRTNSVYKNEFSDFNYYN